MKRQYRQKERIAGHDLIGLTERMILLNGVEEKEREGKRTNAKEGERGECSYIKLHTPTLDQGKEARVQLYRFASYGAKVGHG